MSQSIIQASPRVAGRDDPRNFRGFTAPIQRREHASETSLIWECAERGEAARARAMCDGERDAAYRSGNRSRIAAATRVHGELLALRGAGDVAQSEFLRALELANECGDKDEEVRIRTALARVLANDGPFDEAESIAKSAYDLAVTAPDQRGRIQALAAWGRALMARGDIKRAVPLFFRAMRTARRTDDEFTMRDSWVDLGIALSRNNRNKIAIRLLNTANSYADEHDQRRLALRAQLGLSQAYLAVQNQSEALTFALSAINLANTYGYEGYLPGLYENLGEVYTQMQDFQGAYYAAKQHIDSQRGRLSSQRRHILMLSSLLMDARSESK